ncbi:MAG: hypothetical protein FJ297_15955 [Planctomycetes bacterium]|nr:hypothetical protein [Planctomycetota bacterium]
MAADGRSGNGWRRDPASPRRTLRALLWIAWILVPRSSGAHDVPPGMVERAIQATVRGDRLEIAYRFGLHETTIRDELSRAGLHAAERLEELERQYLDFATARLAAKLSVTLDGKRLTAAPPVGELIYQHHLPFECRLTYWNRFEGSEGRLVIDDGNYRDLPGFFRVAFKARDAGLVRSTDAAPILVRAERRSARQLDPFHAARPRIEATLGANTRPDARDRP